MVHLLESSNVVTAIRVFHKQQDMFPYICSFLLYLQHMMLVNVILDNSGCNRSTL